MNKQPSPPSTSNDQSSFLFNIEVLVEGRQNAEALEQLIHTLNQSGFLDYRILSGIQLGNLIDERKAASTAATDVPLQSSKPITIGKQKAEPTTKTTAAPIESLSGFDKIRALMKSNALIRLIVNKGLGIKLSIPCRIINMDEAGDLISVYHVDEKQVYTFRLNEIEDFSS